MKTPFIELGWLGEEVRDDVQRAHVPLAPPVATPWTVIVAGAPPG
jgi:hypothetical protein